MNSRWKTFLLYASLIIVGGGLIFILVENVKAKNTGFETKTLWDWMELLIIPLVLAVGAFLLNNSERNNDRKLAADHQQEAAFQIYLDRMADLLLNEKLRTEENLEVRRVARTRTLAVLRVLDANRKGQVIQFLFESGLIDKFKPIIDLAGADLRYANLRNADFMQGDLSGVDLRYSNLFNTHLFGANLYKADLRYANLLGANLAGARLELCDLRYAILFFTNLHETNLNHARISLFQLISKREVRQYVRRVKNHK